VSERYRTQRIKRWGSRSERVQNPYWLNPNQIGLIDLEHLSRLNESEDVSRMRKAVEEFAAADGDMLLVRDSANQVHSEHSRIVGFLTFAIVPVLEGRKLIVTGVRIEPECRVDEVHTVLQAELADIAKRNDIRHFDQVPRPTSERRVRNSGYSAVKIVERFDDLVPDDPKIDDTADGTPTRRMGIPGRKH
jgi:hypothetical protein